MGGAAQAPEDLLGGGRIDVAEPDSERVRFPLDRQHPGLRDRLLDDKGVRRFVNIYVGEDDVRFLEGLRTELKAGDALSIVPAIAGG